MVKRVAKAYKFQSTHPVRGATVRLPFMRIVCVLFQSTHPVRGATQPAANDPFGQPISIHAPREGCDPAETYKVKVGEISIHAPREGCDR